MPANPRVLYGRRPMGGVDAQPNVGTSHQTGSLPSRFTAGPRLSREGVQISLGPIDERHLTTWITFPVTPESIPVNTAQTKERYTVVGAGEFPGGGTPNLDTIAFSGRLEPPDYYVRSKDRDGPNRLGQFPVEQDLSNLPFAWSTDHRVQQFAPDAVVMQDGAHAGPTYFLEPFDFRDVLEAIEKDDEVVRLVIGDLYGYNRPVSIETFSWRFEDVDADTLLYDIAFLEHRDQDVMGAARSREHAKQRTYTTKNGDTLHSIALDMWGVEFKAREIAKLNLQKIAGLWWYPDETGSSAQGWREKGSIGHRIPNRSDGFQIARGQVSGQGEMISPDLPWRKGVKLEIDPPDKGKGKGD